MDSLDIILQEPLGNLGKGVALAAVAGLLFLAATLAAAGRFGTKATRYGSETDVASDPYQSCAVLLKGIRALAAVVCGLLLLVLSSTGARALDSKVEAETMTLSGGQWVRAVADSNASGGRAVIYGTNGTATTSFAGEASHVTLRAKAEPCRSKPVLALEVDGVSKGTVTVGTTGYTNYAVDLGNAGVGSHTLEVEFTNDFNNAKCDRNAYLDYVTLTQPGPAPLDTDGDGLPDDVDKCNTEPGPVSNNGCPVPEPPTDKPTCPDSLQVLINNAASSSTVTVRGDCIYRERVSIDKSLTLQGAPGAEIRGSDVWSGWSQRADGLWVSNNTVPTFDISGTCDPSSGRCLRPEQAYIDGESLRQIGSGAIPSTGQFVLDGSRHVVLADNPTGKRVEVTTRAGWVSGGAQNVTIDNVDMRHASNNSQWRAALTNNANANWTLRNVKLAYAHGANVSLRGSNTRIEDSEVHHGGQLGIHASDGSLTVDNVLLHDNNFEAFDPGWEAGALKAVRMSALTVTNSEAMTSDQGFWCDLNCTNVTFAHNLVHHNGWSGLFFEVSTGASIHDNVLYENGWGKAGQYVGGWQGAIHLSLTRNADVYQNTLAWNRAGITAVRYDRCSCPEWEDVYGNHVHDNTILSADYPDLAPSFSSGSNNFAVAFMDKTSEGNAGGGMYASGQDNRGWSNDYYYATGEHSDVARYYYRSAYYQLSAFNATPGEEGGRYLTQSEIDTLAATENLPLEPH